MNTTNFNQLWQELKFASEASQITPDEINILTPILQAELQARQSKRIKYLMQRSGIKNIKRLEDFDWKFNPKIPRELIMPYFEDMQWIESARNILLIGDSGVGKSHLASSLCYRAVMDGIPTAFISCHDLIAKFKRSKNKLTLLQYYSTIKILCLDELGYVFPSKEEAGHIFQIISKRTEFLPTIVTTNLIPGEWNKLFDAATATAILDRLNYRGKFIKMEGDSYRTKA
jgi:DNA replication protein DnaC